MRRALAVAMLLLAGCGGREALQPRPGQGTPPVPYAEETPPTPEKLMTPPAQARPERSDELLRRSEERRDDRFDLPPQG